MSLTFFALDSLFQLHNSHSFGVQSHLNITQFMCVAFVVCFRFVHSIFASLFCVSFRILCHCFVLRMRLICHCLPTLCSSNHCLSLLIHPILQFRSSVCMLSLNEYVRCCARCIYCTAVNICLVIVWARLPFDTPKVSFLWNNSWDNKSMIKCMKFWSAYVYMFEWLDNICIRHSTHIRSQHKIIANDSKQRYERHFA